MTAYINKLKDNAGNQQLPVTHERAVRDSEGTTLESKLQNLEGAMDKAYVASSDNGMGRITLKKNIVSGVNTLTQSMMQATNTIYVIRYDFTLGEDITIPENCVLEFDGGSITDNGNHTLTGNNTILLYKKAFLSNVVLGGTFYTNCKVVSDESVFIDDNYNTNRIKSLFKILCPTNKVVFKKATYSNITSITLDRNIDVDFGGSTINLYVDSYELASDFLVMPWYNRNYGDVLEYVKIQNATIIGNPNCVFTDNIITIGDGPRRRCIQLFNVKDVEMRNITFSNIKNGTEGSGNADWHKRYEVSCVTVFHYNTCVFDNIVVHDCAADNFIYCVPKISKTNMLIYKNSYIYRCYTGLLQLVDGRCSIHDNKFEDCTLSCLNTFCYDSEFYNNVYNVKGDCIDTHEYSLYFSRNVHIYNNLIHNGSGIHVTAKDAVVENNTINAQSGYGIFLGSIKQSNVPQNTEDELNNPLGNDDPGNVRIVNNTINVTNGGIVMNVNTAVKGTPDGMYIYNNKIYSYNEALTSGLRANPISITRVKNIEIRGNYLKGCARAASSDGFFPVIDLGVNNTIALGGNIICDDNVFDFPSIIVIGGVNRNGNAIYIAGVYTTDFDSTTPYDLYFNRNTFITDPARWSIIGHPVYARINNNNGCKTLNTIASGDSMMKRVLVKGDTSYDNTNNKPIYYDGSVWKYADGTQV